MKESMIGFWGYPDPQIIKTIKETYPNATWIDLDIDYKNPRTNILPDSYCKIIKNIIDNTIYLKDKIIKIIAPIGKDKCDSGWFAAAILKDLGFNVETTIFENKEPVFVPRICESNLPLKKKFELITGNIIARAEVNYTKTNPKFGFWGVPPNDLSILDMMPDETHVYGWTRCVEAGCPANLELEMYVNPAVPTVFYAQSFCSKTQLAKYLADKYNGLFIDVDDYATKSTRAKIEAFVKLR